MVFIASSFAQDSNSKRLAFGIYGGVQIPGYVDDTYLDVGPWFGLSVNIPTGLGWCIQFEYNFWKSTNTDAEPDEDLFVSEFPLLVGYKWDLDKYYIQTLAGPGIGSSGSTLFGGDRDYIVSFDAALKIGLIITKNSEGFIQVRKQWALSPNFAYNPWLIGLGIQYRLSQ
jgi:hypothetical protein